MAIEVKAKPAPAAPKPRVSPGEFVRQVRAEFARVTWPTLPETVRMTIMVLIMTSLLSVFFVGIDQVLGRIVKFLLSLAA
jgi:preprotein translocase subunit SecE